MKQKCPICQTLKYEYESYTEDVCGAMIIVEQHGYCDNCGFTVEQCYSGTIYGFSDNKKGRKLNGIYYPKNIRKHKRYRRKAKQIGTYERLPMLKQEWI